MESDPTATQRDAGSAVVTELRAAGFDNPELIGRGGFGLVYRCRQPALDRLVAVKVLTGNLDEDRERFLREQHAMGRLTGHPNMVGVLEVGETGGGYPYLVMQYHQHASLDGRIRHDRPLSLDEVLRLGVKMAGALETAHRMGVVHRDVKPANILFTSYGEPALTDFGIAHMPGAFTTADGSVTGSPAFTAPEVISGETPTAASDVYGLGATLFCALTGHAAFERRHGEQLVTQFLRITTEPVPDLRANDIPDDVAAAIESAMSRDPRDRPSVVALGEQLQRIQRHHGYPVDEMALPSDSPVDSRANARDIVTGRGHRTTGNLPMELTSFVGRTHELADVAAMISQSRLVTLTGIGGVGKTRLALRAASQIRPRFPDGVWLVELGELSDGSLLTEAVAGALGLRDQSARPLHDVLTGYLATRDALLVLDNCEQVVDAVAKLAETLLRACPTLRIIATSREPLGIGGEAVLWLAPLEFPDAEADDSRDLPEYDAAALFAERAAAAAPGFELTAGNKPIVARICQRLDGLPLALELAAARLRAMSLAQLLERISDRYTLLNRGSRGAPARQQTLEWSVGWSYDLCTSAEQRLWSRLSVFAGTFDLDAAQYVCGNDLPPDEFVDLMSALVDKSILTRSSSGDRVRFRMLQMLRAFGSKKLESPAELLNLRRRHRGWFERMAADAERDWFSPRQRDWMTTIAQELPNLREALEFSESTEHEDALVMATAILPYWTTRGLLNEGRRLLDRALADAPPTASAGMAKALFGAATMAVVQGDLPAAERRLRQAQAMFEGVTDPTTRLLICYADVLTGQLAGDLDRGVSALEAAIDPAADPMVQAGAMLTLGWADEMHGDIPGALSWYERVLELSDAHGEFTFRINTLWSIGIARWRLGELKKARHALRQGLRYARENGDRRASAECLEALAWVMVDEPRTAMVLMSAAKRLRHAVGSRLAAPPQLVDYHNECQQRVRDALDDDELEEARRKAASQSFEEAVDYALHV